MTIDLMMLNLRITDIQPLLGKSWPRRGAESTAPEIRSIVPAQAANLDALRARLVTVRVQFSS
jgi:hypothetical protein